MRRLLGCLALLTLALAGPAVAQDIRNWANTNGSNLNLSGNNVRVKSLGVGGAAGATGGCVTFYGTTSGSVAMCPATAAGAGQITLGQVGVIPKIANYTIQTTDSGATFTNCGAAGEVDFTLPASAAGLRFNFVACAAQVMKVIAVGSDVIRDGAAVTAAAGTIQPTNTAGTAAVIGTTGALEGDASGGWTMHDAQGPWAGYL